MKDIIKEYIELTEDEKRVLWNQATFVFDTNVLLNLYRYSNKTRMKLYNSFELLDTRIWIPYQVASEFCKNRYEVIYEINKRFTDMENDADKLINDWSKKLRVKEDGDDLKELHDYINIWIQEQKVNYLNIDILKDSVFNKVLELFDGKVGTPFNDQEKEQIEREGEKRYKDKVPPGYKDSSKSDNRYGDLFIWKEILKYSQSQEKDIIYVTNDTKEDMWFDCHGKTIGPRIELRKEFYETTGHKFHMYQMQSFLRTLSQETKSDIDEATMKEVDAVSKYNHPVSVKAQKALYHEQVESLYEEQEILRQIDKLKQKNKKREQQIASLRKKEKKGQLGVSDMVALRSNSKHWRDTNEEIEKLQKVLDFYQSNYHSQFEQWQF